jgi:hypothetical protein
MLRWILKKTSWDDYKKSKNRLSSRASSERLHLRFLLMGNPHLRLLASPPAPCSRGHQEIRTGFLRMAMSARNPSLTALLEVRATLNAQSPLLLHEIPNRNRNLTYNVKHCFYHGGRPFGRQTNLPTFTNFQ